MSGERIERILIIEDDRASRALLCALLEKNYEVAAVETGEEGLILMPAFRPALVLLDLMLPGIDGFETCRRIRSCTEGFDTHVIIVSACSSWQEQARAYREGAEDYVVKPIESQEFLARIRLHFRLRDAKESLQAARAELDTMTSDLHRKLADRASEIQATQDAAILALARVAECRDDDTGAHLYRMRSYSQVLAERLRRDGPYMRLIDHRFLEDLYRSSLLHDIGKVGISDTILLKPGPLTPAEFQRMKQHTIIGANMLERVVLYTPAARFLSMAAVIARFHHERFDGTGYPAGLQGTEIPLSARIVALADVYDALTSDRPYKSAWSPERARRTIVAETGSQFDPAIVAAFEDSLEEFLTVREDCEQREIQGAVCVPEHLEGWPEPVGSY